MWWRRRHGRGHRRLVALRGFTVTLQDAPSSTVQRRCSGRRSCSTSAYAIRRRRAPARGSAPDVAGAGVPGADVEIEAIFENLEAKQELYAQLSHA